MQRSWRGDRDKLTFIICQPLRQKDDREQRPGMSHVRVGEDDSPERMIGDINLFLFDAEIEEGEREVEELGGSGSGSVVGEVELMVSLHVSNPSTRCRPTADQITRSHANPSNGKDSAVQRS